MPNDIRGKFYIRGPTVTLGQKHGDHGDCQQTEPSDLEREDAPVKDPDE